MCVMDIGEFERIFGHSNMEGQKGTTQAKGAFTLGVKSGVRKMNSVQMCTYIHSSDSH